MLAPGKGLKKTLGGVVQNQYDTLRGTPIGHSGSAPDAHLSIRAKGRAVLLSVGVGGTHWKCGF